MGTKSRRTVARHSSSHIIDLSLSSWSLFVHGYNQFASSNFVIQPTDYWSAFEVFSIVLNCYLFEHLVSLVCIYLSILLTPYLLCPPVPDRKSARVRENALTRILSRYQLIIDPFTPVKVNS